LERGEQSSGLQRTLLVTDSINGLGAELDLGEWLFVPPSLTGTMHRHLETDWLLLDARTTIGSNGIGTTQAPPLARSPSVGMGWPTVNLARRPWRLHSRSSSIRGLPVGGGSYFRQHRPRRRND